MSDKNDLLDKIADYIKTAPGTWQEKRDALLAAADTEQKTNLLEFASWFDYLDPDEDK